MLRRRRSFPDRSRESLVAAPQYYQVVCPDGHLLRGQRSATYQALRCPECGNGVFVLPRSPLPDPPPPTRRPRRSPDAEPAPTPPDEPIEYRTAPVHVEATDAAEIIWDDELPPTPLTPEDHELPEEYRSPRSPEPLRSQPVPPSPPAPPADARSDPPRPTAPTRRAATQPAQPPTLPSTPPRTRRRTSPAVEPSSRLVELPGPARRRLHPAWVITGVLVLAGSTVFLRLWQARLERLPGEAQENWSAGLAALESGNFDAARQHLGRAASAFERLGGSDPRTPEARQLAREAAILADLINVSLEELLDEAARQDNFDRWTSRFETLYKGRSLIIDTTIEGLPPPGASPGAYGLAYRVLSGRGPRPARVGRLDLNGFHLFEDQKLAPGDPVLFGARLASIRLQDTEWLIGLEPDSGVLITRSDALQRTDWDSLQSARANPATPRLEPDSPRPFGQPR
ncbi:MAG: hypothetical protein KatS3mg108_3093 [Isosphaeraceae bacterium]|nr:MAG: hypothetical protein KatS3mg108_3093 [Isosphaeraceae bacterium]